MLPPSLETMRLGAQSFSFLLTTEVFYAVTFRS